MDRPLKLCVGLTGGIGSGKSTVAQMLSELGARVVDTDAIAHELTGPDGAALPALRAVFGPQYFTADGGLDRARMRQQAFADSSVKHQLEAILHPLIREEARQRALAESDAPYTVVVVPLLYESGRYDWLSPVIVVDCPEDMQVERAMARSNLDEATVRAIMAQQLPRVERLCRADVAIVNDRDLATLKVQVATLHRQLLEKIVEAQRACQPATPSAPSRTVFAHTMLIYEFPLSERARTLLRLEDLFSRIDYFISGKESADHHAALDLLFEIMEVASRADLKSELLQELERQKKTLGALRNNPAVAEDALEDVLDRIETASAALLNNTGKLCQHLRENEWLMAIRQRAIIPGGVCEFDLPSYHYWQHQPVPRRRDDLHGWLAPLLPVRDAIVLLLQLMRESGKTHRFTAHQGTFQQVQGGRVAQMLRLGLDVSLPCTPEVSANKYMLNIRFLDADFNVKGTLYEPDVEFTLTFCSL
ncbi:MAG: hypothetical protein OHK0054_01180 [Sideroxydans sp.]